MCSNPMTKDGYEFACRRCDECVAARRADWVSRAMAEKATSSYSLVIALTYSDENQFTRDGAAMFRYSDIRLFLARIRRAITYRTGKPSTLRFLAAGEQGSRTGRCHWHLVLFSDYDITQLGEFRNASGPVTDRADIFSGIGVSGKKKRLNWDLWPHGFCVLQEPDVGGMHYALSYALKDQFSVTSSEGSRRLNKAEIYSTGLFRQSKSPPIGLPFISALLERLRSKNSVLPSLHLMVPDQSHYWYPRGTIRKALLEGLARINSETVALTGRSCPQWATLLSTVKDNPKDLEILLGPEIEKDEDFISDRNALERSNRYRQDEANRAKVRRRCGAQVACRACLLSASLAELEANGIEAVYNEEELTFRLMGEEGGEGLRRAQNTPSLQGVNPLCYLKGSRVNKSVFPSSA